jgi:hypothetical protein
MDLFHDFEVGVPRLARARHRLGSSVSLGYSAVDMLYQVVLQSQFPPKFVNLLCSVDGFLREFTSAKRL